MKLLRYLLVQLVAHPVSALVAILTVLGLLVAHDLRGLFLALGGICALLLADHYMLAGRGRKRYRVWSRGHKERVITRAGWSALTDDLGLSRSYADGSVARPRLRRVDVQDTE